MIVSKLKKQADVSFKHELCIWTSSVDKIYRNTGLGDSMQSVYKY